MNLIGKGIIAASAILSIIFVPAQVFATGTGVVAATVTVQNVSVSVSSGTVAYGTLATNTSLTTLAAPGLNDQQTATNNGNVPEDFSINGQNSANWTLDTRSEERRVGKECR